MTYKTLRYDMSRPSTRQITEPLNSVYGVAVKVYRDWQPVSADLSVGGTACVDGRGGWKFAELSSGNSKATKELDVEFSAPPTARAELSTDYTYSATQVS